MVRSRFIPGAFGEHDTDPETPFDELRWINDSNKRMKLVAATSVPPRPNTNTPLPVEEERRVEETLDQPFQIMEETITPSQRRVDVTAIHTLAPEGTDDAPTQTISQTGSSVGNQVPSVCLLPEALSSALIVVLRDLMLEELHASHAYSLSY